jgi:hypothetical protein
MTAELYMQVKINFMKDCKFIIITLALLVSFPAFSWKYSNHAQIKNIIMHEEGISRDETIVAFKDTVSGESFYCHIGGNEKNLTSLILALYMSGKEVIVHCHEDSKTIGSYSARKLHRVVTN